jgi:membrane protease YdiL (CAAX protease family)
MIDTSHSPGALLKEVGGVFLLQLVLVTALVNSDRYLKLGGNLHMLVGVVFILLPILVLDRRGKPYRRYGFAVEKLHMDLLWALIFAIVLFPPIAIGAPFVWGVGEASWSFVLPEGYPSLALVHLIAIALPEEVFYRGYVMGRLDDVFAGRVRLLGAKVGWALPIQAVLFAAGHYLVDFNPGRLAVFFPALAFGWLKARRGTLGAGVIFHALSNIFMDLFRTGLGL